MNDTRLSVRFDLANANHHLWNNHGTWWCHYTLHLPGFTKLRLRRSPATQEVFLARQRGDRFLARADCQPHGPATGRCA
ncbi:MAG: hypothetical protein FJ387_14655 [Verrucomicrobia bacterium]|nr:hypothetical protein [Verrucomicrobiota bacterium]